MKNKVLKRTLAAALALTLVSGAPAAVRGGKGIFPLAITANAATKNIEVGAVFGLNDTIDFGEKGAGILYDDGHNEQRNGYFYGEHTISSVDYLDSKSKYRFNLDGIGYIYVTSEDIGKFAGLKVDSGNGTFEDRFQFTVVESSPYTRLDSVSVALNNSIILRYWANKEDIDAANVASVTLAGPNGDITIEKNNFVDAGSRYLFNYPLYTTQLDENVNISFHNSDNEVITIKDKGDSYSYNVNDYLDVILADTTGYNLKEQKAAKSLMNLGLASQNYFGCTNTINFIDETEAVKTDLAAFSADFDAKLSLVLDSNLAVRLYIEGLEIGEKSDDSEYTAVAGLDGKACFEVTTLKPSELDKIYDIEYKGKSYSFSALSYCARAVNNTTNPNSPVIAQAVYEYYKYMKNYVTPKTYNLNKTVTFYNTYSGPDAGSEKLVIPYEDGMTWEELISESSINNEYLFNDGGYLKKKPVLVDPFYIYKDGNKIPVTDTIDENGYYTYYYYMGL